MDCWGAMAETTTCIPCSSAMLAASMIRRWFSMRSEGENPSSWLSPWRMRSPSSHRQGVPMALYWSTSRDARVVFPAPERPNSQMILVFDANASSKFSIFSARLSELRAGFWLFAQCSPITWTALDITWFPQILEIFAVPRL